MDVEVLELCTRTVTRIPTTRPATGLDRIAFSLNIVPATLPVHKRRGRTKRWQALWDVQSLRVKRHPPALTQCWSGWQGGSLWKCPLQLRISKDRYTHFIYPKRHFGKRRESQKSQDEAAGEAAIHVCHRKLMLLCRSWHVSTFKDQFEVLSPLKVYKFLIAEITSRCRFNMATETFLSL